MENVIFKKAKKEVNKAIIFMVILLAIALIFAILWLGSDEGSASEMYVALAVLCLFYAVYHFISYIGQKSSIKELQDSVSLNNINMASQEMTDTSTISYEKSNLYLTPHYLINLKGRHSIIPYEDILWMYRYTLYQNGRKKEDNIIVFTNMGERYPIGTKRILKSKNTINAIFERCSKSNPYIVFGYSDENIAACEEMCHKINQIKSSGKDPRMVFRPADIEHTPLN